MNSIRLKNEKSIRHESSERICREFEQNQIFLCCYFFEERIECSVAVKCQNQKQFK